MSDNTDRIYESVLVLRCQAGDRDAFEEIVGRYQPRLRFFLEKMVRDSETADDLLQETWCDVYRKLPGLRDRGAVTSWIYQIARRRALQELRKRRLRFVPLEEPEAWADEEPSFTADDAEAVRNALDRLQPAHREVLLLRFVEQMSYEDIARVTGLALGTVRSRIHYAKHALRDELEEK